MSTVSNTSHRPDAQRRVQRGFVSAEMGLVIIMGAIMLVAAVYVFLNNRKQAAITENTNQIIGIAEQAKKLYGSRAEYINVNQAIAGATLLPTQLRDRNATGPLAAGTATNSYGGGINFTPQATVVGGATDILILRWNNVPRAHCVDLVLGTANPMRQVNVAGTIVKPLDGQINIATLNTQCETGDNVAVDFWIGRG